MHCGTVSVRGAAKHAIAHERLAIIDPESGAQPLFAAECKDSTGKILIEEGSIIVAANGEIYNYKGSTTSSRRRACPTNRTRGATARSSFRSTSSSASRKPVACCGGADRVEIKFTRWRGDVQIMALVDATGCPHRNVLVHHLRPTDGFYGAARDHIGITSYLGRGFGRVGLDRVGDEIVSERLS